MKTADIAVFTEDKAIWLGTRYYRANVRACMDSSMLPCKGKGLEIEPSVTVASNSQLTQHRADGKQLIIRYQGNDAGDVVVATDKKQQYLFDFYVRNDLVVHGAKIFFRFTAKRNGVEEFYGESDAIGYVLICQSVAYERGAYSVECCFRCSPLSFCLPSSYSPPGAVYQTTPVLWRLLLELQLRSLMHQMIPARSPGTMVTDERVTGLKQ